MSKQANPLTVGLFLVTSLALLIFALMTFGGGDMFKTKNRYVIFFDSALNGLNIGAPVKLQGVQIGNVREISLEMDIKSKRIFKPVVIEIEPDTLRNFSDQPFFSDRDSAQFLDAQHLINAGLKARLETQSLLTGLLYVDLNFYTDKPASLQHISFKGLPELPSVPTTVDEIRNTVDEVIKKVRQLPLEQMIQDLSETLRETRDILKSQDMHDSLASLAQTLRQTQELTLALNRQTEPLLRHADNTLDVAQADMRVLQQQLPPILQAAERSLNLSAQVLEDSRYTLREVEASTNPDSMFGQTLKEMRDAARAMKDLSESLERKPEALLYGK